MMFLSRSIVDATMTASISIVERGSAMPEYGSLAVGRPYPGFADRGEGAWFDVDGSGGSIVLKFVKPTAKEVDAIRNGDVDITATVIGDVIYLTAKFGDIARVDMPYSAHLSLADVLDVFPNPSDGEGLALTVALADHPSCVVRAMRLLGLTTEFTRALRGLIEDQMEQPFDETAYLSFIEFIKFMYSTEEIAAMASAVCTIRPH